MFYCAELGDWFMFEESKYTVSAIIKMRKPLVDVKQLLLDCRGHVYIINYFDGKSAGMRKFNTKNT